MELIQKLALIVADYSQEQPEIFIKSKLDALKKNGFKEKEGKDASYYRAFHALRHGEVQTDEELRAHIFPNGTSDANYRSFKSRLKKRLVNSIMLISIDADEVSNTDAAEVEAIYYVYTAFVSGILGGSDFTKELHDKAIMIAMSFFISNYDFLRINGINQGRIQL